jgi:hypothetical protein
VTLEFHELVHGVDPALFWQESMGRQQWESMAAKYAALARVARLAEAPRGAEYKQALVELSSRWPGALREGELIGPERVERRRAAAEAGLAAPERARAEWPEQDARAVICWAELHVLLGDQLEFRRSPGASPRTTEAFAAWLASEARAARWPAPQRLPELLGPKLEVRGAYMWLAARTGLILPRLNALLLARAGHWDRRPGDPPWAHAKS